MTTRSPGCSPVLHANPVPVARGDFHVSPRKPFTADLDEDVRPAGFHQHRRFRNRRNPLRAFVDRGWRFPSARRAVEPPGFTTSNCTGSAWVVASTTPASCMCSNRRGIGSGRPAISSATAGDRASRGSVGRRHLRAQFDAIGANDLEERRALVVRRAQGREHLRHAAADGRPQHERVPGRGPAAGSPAFRHAAPGGLRPHEVGLLPPPRLAARPPRVARGRRDPPGAAPRGSARRGRRRRRPGPLRPRPPALRDRRRSTASAPAGRGVLRRERLRRWTPTTRP